MSETTQLVRYDAMCRAIAEAAAVDEVKDIRDKARAIEMYARQAMNIEAEEQARAIRLRAERKCGSMLAEIERSKGGRPANNSSHDGTSFSSERMKAGISPKQAENWQKLAAVPEELFEEALRDPNPSTAGIIMRHEVEQRPPGLAMTNDRALWLWGVLLDFKRDGVLDEDPNELIADMLEHMKTTTRELAPRVVAWLERIGT